MLRTVLTLFLFGSPQFKTCITGIARTKRVHVATLSSRRRAARGSRPCNSSPRCFQPSLCGRCLCERHELLLRGAWRLRSGTAACCRADEVRKSGTAQLVGRTKRRASALDSRRLKRRAVVSVVDQFVLLLPFLAVVLSVLQLAF